MKQRQWVLYTFTKDKKKNQRGSEKTRNCPDRFIRWSLRKGEKTEKRSMSKKAATKRSQVPAVSEASRLHADIIGRNLEDAIITMARSWAERWLARYQFIGADRTAWWLGFHETPTETGTVLIDTRPRLRELSSVSEIASY